MKVLVVDDSRAIRSMIRKMLAADGFEVLEAGHGREALAQLAKAGPLDLALVDWNMPEMNGLEFVTAVRGDHAYDAMPMMMVTTETEIEQIGRALRAGANEYMMKPFTADALREKIGLLGVGAR